jgi:hypothetical protein
MCVGCRWIAATILTVPGSAIEVDVAEIFRQLDLNKRPA